MQLNLSGLSKNNLIDYETVYDVIIIGAGPAGFNASLYAKRKGLKTLLVTYDLGGQLENTSIVDNYLGFESIDGSELNKKFLEHIKALNVDMITSVYVNEIKKIDNVFYLTLSTFAILKSKTIILATGGSHKKLEVKGEDIFANKGVSYCAICDAPFFKNKHVIVAGGGNSAVEAAMDISKWASKVTIVQRSTLRADQILIDKLFENEKISVILNTNIREIIGSSRMEAIKVYDNKNDKEYFIDADGLFVEIGTIPNSMLVKNLVKLNTYGEVVVDNDQMTSLDGLFAAGDVTDGKFKQIIIAASEGAKAALSASQYIQKNKE